MVIDERFIRAINDYSYLTEKGYPAKGFLMLVGNRYSLSSIQRTMLYRGIASTESSNQRKKKLISPEEIKTQSLYIDGFNILTTIASYLLGKVLFISSDNVLRDASDLRGKLSFDIKMEEAFVLLDNYLLRFQGEKHIYLDEKVSFCQEVVHKFSEISKANHTYKIKFHISQTVDNDLSSIENGLIVTSDSQIIDKSVCGIFDLPHYLLLENFQPDFLDLDKLINRK